MTLSDLNLDASHAAALLQGKTDAAQVLAALAKLGISDDIAAALLGATLEHFREVLDAHPALSKAWNAGQKLADTQVTHALFQSALAGKIQAQKFWLSNRLPEVFSLYGQKGPRMENGGRPQREKAQEPFDGLKLIG